MKTINRKRLNNHIGAPALFVLVFSMAALSFSTPTYAADCMVLPSALCGDGADIGQMVEFAINILKAGAMIVALFAIIYGAFLWTTASGSAEQLKKARTMFINAGIGIALYALLEVLLNWIIPGR